MKTFLSNLWTLVKRDWHWLTIIAMLVFLVASLWMSLDLAWENQRDLSRRIYESEKNK